MRLYRGILFEGGSLYSYVRYMPRWAVPCRIRKLKICHFGLKTETKSNRTDCCTGFYRNTHIEKAKSPSSLWKYCGVDVSPTQVKYNSKAHDLCLELAELLSREGFAYSSIYIADATNTFSERARLLVAKVMLAHIFEQWKERLGTLKPENIPPDRPFPDRSLYGWPAVEGQRAVDNQR